jgi:hypothetical protein
MSASLRIPERSAMVGCFSVVESVSRRSAAALDAKGRERGFTSSGLPTAIDKS